MNASSNPFDQLYTIDDLATFRTNLESLEKAALAEPQARQQTINTHFPKDQAEFLNRYLEKAKGEPKQLIEQLVQDLAIHHEIKLTLAIHPSYELLQNIADWVKTNLGPRTLLNLDYDPSLIGGAQVEYQGKFRDFTVKKFLDKYLEVHQEEISKRFSSNQTPSSDGDQSESPDSSEVEAKNKADSSSKAS